MMNSKLRIIISLALCFVLTCAAPLSALAKTGDMQQEQNIITISDADEFLEFAENCRLNSYSIGLTVILKADIDLSGESFDGIPMFGGCFDGNSRTISGVKIHSIGSVQGLFRYLLPTAQVYDLNVKGEVSPGGSHVLVGGIAGSNAGNIRNCIFSGNVTGAERVGCVAGRNELTGIIEDCSAFGSVHADHFVGGIAGENLGVIRRCTNYAKANTTAEHNSIEISDITVESLTGSENVATTTDIGGITGSNSGVIRECDNRGNVGYPHIGYNVGGIAGSQIGYITGCANYADVYGRKETGGIVGQMEPSTLIEYEPDTIQILQQQLGEMSSMIDGVAADAHNAAGELSDQTTILQGQIGSAMDAVNQLLPKDGVLPDEDSTNAAMNNLSGAMSSIPGTLESIAGTGSATTDALTANMQVIAQQLDKIGGTVGNAPSTVGGSFADVSDEDTDGDTSGKVELCVNYGYVQADINAGGVVGAISMENDLDPESDVQISGDSSMNFDCEIRAVILRCENRGLINTKRQNAGGIAGWMAFGLVRECENTGAVDAQAADYVGGIAGRSEGYIRMCSAKCVLAGNAYVGGIVGQADTVSDCRSIVLIDSGSEKLGAVIGYSEEVLSFGAQTIRVQNNCYLKTEGDIGGVDGISYSGVAEPLSMDDFFALDALPEIFGIVTVRFVFEDGEETAVVIAPGGDLLPSDIPQIPEKPGYTGVWDGLDQFDCSGVFYDASFDVLYTQLDSTLSSTNTRENGLPVLLAIGDFSTNESLTLVQLSDAPQSELEIVEGWEFSFSTGGSDIELRYMLPSGSASEETLLMVRDSSGTWREVDFTTDGSYLRFSINDTDDAFCAYHVPRDYSLEMVAVGISAGLLIIVLIIAVVKRKNKVK